MRRSRPDARRTRKLIKKEPAKSIEELNSLPLLPLRDVVVFPGMVVPLYVGRPRSVAALDAASQDDSKHILLVTQRIVDCDEPKQKDLYKAGTLAQILQMLKLPDGSVKVLVEGVSRQKLISVDNEGSCMMGFSDEMIEPTIGGSEVEALVRYLQNQFETYVRLNRKIPQETLASILNMSDPGRLADHIAIHAALKVSDKQKALATIAPQKRLAALTHILLSEIEILELEQKIRGEVRGQMEKSQKEYYLNEQIKAIQKELGRDNENSEEIEEIQRKVKEANMTKEAQEKVAQEIQRLQHLPLMSPEAAVVRNYLECLTSLPWDERTKDRLDVDLAESILNEDHYALDKPKERILEFLAVKQLTDVTKGPILCFVGPPGVGKTSLGRSVARALNRKFVHMSLGGVRDEAEIRGHRRTYIGALPGRIIHNIRKIGSRNPVFLLDEVDKMSVDFRGDPSSALLEVLDPEQNSSFVDHYLEVEFDLSDVMFIATANVLHTIPPALKDRMEVIEISSYTEREKFQIAKDFLSPKQIKNNGLKKSKVEFTDQSLYEIIRGYTREAGVRNLERQIGSVLRKIARQVASGKIKRKKRVTPRVVDELLGVPKFRRPKYEFDGGVGQVTGLAWTEVGGEVLCTEATLLDGKGDLMLTGRLGNVMQESAKAAMTFARSRAKQLNLARDFHKRYDIHIHLPEGGIPKDGPSAGITMATAIVSILTGRPVKGKLAMTGEITLRGHVLPIGGVKEKLIAAHRSQITHILLPKDNEKDLEDLPDDILNALNVQLVENMDEVLEAALC